MMPHTCGATLPTAERYANEQFRRVSRNFDPYRMDYNDVEELFAFLEFVPLRYARVIFHWGRGVPRKLELLGKLPRNQDMVLANAQGVDSHDGFALIDAMKDGGWTHGGLPKVSRMAIAQFYHETGMSVRKCSIALDIPKSVVFRAVKGYEHDGATSGPFRGV